MKIFVEPKQNDQARITLRSRNIMQFFHQLEQEKKCKYWAIVHNKSRKKKWIKK